MIFGAPVGHYEAGYPDYSGSEAEMVLDSIEYNPEAESLVSKYRIAIIKAELERIAED